MRYAEEQADYLRVMHTPLSGARRSPSSRPRRVLCCHCAKAASSHMYPGVHSCLIAAALLSWHLRLYRGLLMASAGGSAAMHCHDLVRDSLRVVAVLTAVAVAVGLLVRPESLRLTPLLSRGILLNQTQPGLFMVCALLPWIHKSRC